MTPLLSALAHAVAWRLGDPPVACDDPRPFVWGERPRHKDPALGVRAWRRQQATAALELLRSLAQADLSFPPGELRAVRTLRAFADRLGGPDRATAEVLLADRLGKPLGAAQAADAPWMQQ